MEDNTETHEYETPRIEDHGDLTELTASGTVGGYADGTVYQGQPFSGHQQPGTTP